jgi:sporulation protein YlmC with PRC-barrel domain
MRKKLTQILLRTLAISCVVPLASLPLSAVARTTNAVSGKMLGHLEEGRKLAGVAIKNAQNQPLGRIEDAVIDLESGRILYTIAAINGLKDRVAIPPETFNVQGPPMARTHIVNVDQTKLSTAPKFSAEQESQLGNTAFASQVYQFFGTPAWWEGANAGQAPPAGQATGSFNNVHKLTALFDKSVKDVSNADFGKISDVIVDLSQARVPFVILTKQPGADYAIPPNAFTLSADKQNLTTGIDQNVLASAPRFTKGNVQMLANPATAAAIYRHFGKQPYFGEGLAPTGRDTNTYVYPGK